MTERDGRPRFSIVTAVYDVEPYLPEFIESVERQRIPADQLEVIAVDDGSTDGSRALLDEWAARSRFRVVVETQENAGQGAARNRGLGLAAGEWVTFADPDDMLDDGFLDVVGRFASAHPDVELHSARPVIYHEATGARTINHPRRWQYAHGNRVADLDSEPTVFLGVAPGSCFRLDRIRAAGLRFDTRIRPNFEDAHFAVRYLLDLPQPRIGLLRDARYVYRKRAAGTSTLQRSFGHPGRYGDVPEYGYLDVLERGRRADGRAAPWVQQLVAYELSWYFSADDRITTEVELPPELAPRFLELLGRVLGELEPDVLERGMVRWLPAYLRDVLAHGGRDVRWHSPVVVRQRADRAMGLRRLGYRYAGRAPAIDLRAGDEPIEPAFSKIRAHRYFGHDMLWERILWVPDRDGLEVRLDGVPTPIADRWPAPPADPLRRPTLRDRLWLLRAAPASRFVRRQLRRGVRIARRARAAAIRAAARLPAYARFQDAWVLMDRIHDADDNAERLFEYLREHRPDINAWFVLERGTPDWERLRARGERRLVAHGSFTWKMLMRNCRWLVSSHADGPIADPPQLRRIAPPSSRKLGFLQHGVIKDDLSRWLNRRDLDLFVTSTPQEHESVVGDGSTYRFTGRETRMTGLPRFDRLLRLGAAPAAANPDLVIVAPTWRQWLTLPTGGRSQRRTVDLAFWESDYLAQWLGLLRSPAVAAAATARGRRIAFMPHPNLQSILPELELPNHVEALQFAGQDVQALYARCALLVTDYSSVAFNIAYLDRPVVYFQFDRAAMFGGAHVGRQGYFEYERDGYGPVAEDLAGAEQAIVAAIEAGPKATATYQARIDAAFPVRDGGACARVVAAIEELSRPYVPTPG